MVHANNGNDSLDSTIMDNRIKELMIQAMTETGGLMDVQATYQRFAELIVEECGDVAYRAFWDNPETVRGIHIKQKIKEHFGVE